MGIRTKIAAAAGFWAMSACAAFASSGGDPSIGSTLSNALNNNIAGLFVGITGLCWIGGVIAFFGGLGKLARAGESGPHHEFRAAGLARVVAGIMLIALPDAAGIGAFSIYGDGVSNIFGSSSEWSSITQGTDYTVNASGIQGDRQSNIQSIVAKAGVEAPVDCLGSGQGVTCIARNLAKNAVPIGIYAVYTLCMISGLMMAGGTLFALMKAYNGGGHQGLPQGFWAKALVAVVLLNSPWLIAMFATTLQGTGGVLSDQGFLKGSPLLSYHYGASGSTSSGLFAKYEELIGYILVIMAFFGVWAFFRGIFMAKATAEGKQGGTTYGHALVFMAGGVLLANAKMSICMILYTFGGNGMTLGFCS